MKLEFRDVSRVYVSKTVKTTALNNLSFQIPSGTFVTISGPSGCGKTSLLSVAGLLAQPTAGSILLDDIDVTRLSNRHRLKLRRQNISYIFQSLNLIEEISTRENVMLQARYCKVPIAECRERADWALDLLGLSYRANHMPNELSGGQRQRVAIARAFASKSSLLLADEPTGNLDRESGRLVIDALMSFKEAGKTVVVVTHDPEIAELGDMQLALQGGALATSDALAAQ